ncbi:histidine kinase [Siphonobacter sp. SORGH_AS_0500]|uniref:sensor histidine kinase n=1 Tax=Siphonobacter sp. SORGH_AS_0500 TaxID=1864824 RepID=UPI0028572BBF|nr:histidine kinase [Siphonobacter sp. SORGH_AS_0500]MDR6197167.1 sensor histidine kinase YesM [Siphonobacter sp. SORGH_AS_0500]
MKSFRLSIWQQWLLHAFLFWLLLELSELVTFFFEVQTGGAYSVNPDGTPLSLQQRFIHHNVTQAIWAVILLGTLPIELSYHLVFKKRSLLYFLCTSILIALSLVALLCWFNRWKFKGEVNDVGKPAAIIAGYGFMYALLRDAIDQRINRAQQQIQQAKAELTTLKSHLNPHFLFNTLNTLYGSALLEKAEQTALSIEQLASIMRYTLTEASYDFTSVTNEFRFIQDYLQLQQLRLPTQKSIQIKTDLFYDEKPAQIPPLLLIPFIENAFKYGIRMDQPCFLTLQLSVENKELKLLIENSRFPPQQDQTRLGTGIAHTQKRLDWLYPDKHQLSINANEHYYQVRLQISLH